MENLVVVLEKANAAGLNVQVEGDGLLVEGHPTNEALVMVEELRRHKPEVIAFLKNVKAEGVSPLFDLPFPIGYGGLPKAQVEAAVAYLDSRGFKDPVTRKYNVVSWVIDHFIYGGRTDDPRYEELKAEEQRLGGILDERPCPECNGRVHHKSKCREGGAQSV